jgi:hypothetical protein
MKTFFFISPRFPTFIVNCKFPFPRASIHSRSRYGATRTQPSVISDVCGMRAHKDGWDLSTRVLEINLAPSLWAPRKYYKAINFACEESGMLFPSLHRIASQVIVLELTFRSFLRRLEDSARFPSIPRMRWIAFPSLLWSIRNTSTFSARASHRSFWLTHICHSRASAKFIPLPCQTSPRALMEWKKSCKFAFFISSPLNRDCVPLIRARHFFFRCNAMEKMFRLPL